MLRQDMLKIGNKAFTFSLPSSSGETVRLADLSGSIVVLYFYPKDNSPGCTTEAKDFQAALSKFRRQGAAVYGVSKDSIESHCKFIDKQKLKFELLSDASGKTIEKYAAWGEKNMYGKKYMGIVRSTVIIDEDGRIAYHWPKVRVKGHVDEVLAAVKVLAQD